MFMGASLNPTYFEENLNLFVALAPIANMHNVEVPSLHKASNLWREI